MSAKPVGKWRERALNLGLSALSLTLFLGFCEFVVFRFVLPGSDVPRNAYLNEVVRYAPGQSGTWRIRDEIAAPYRINARGWNSPLPDYPRERKPGVTRIAFVGDSFVEALQVPVDRSLAETTAAGLGPPGGVETFRYAISGAPLSQYLHMVEREVVEARPDRIVVLLVHNDFDESFVLRPGRYTSSFRKLRIEGGRVVAEEPPSPWRPGALEWLRQTATARFFLYRWQVRPQALADLVFGPARADGHAANIDIAATLAREADIRAATDHLVGRLAAVTRAAGAELLLVMDGDRAAIYAGRPDSPALVLNAITAEAAGRAGVPFLDLHPVFARDFAEKRERFEFAADYHWNERGHALAGAAVAALIQAR